MTTIFLLFSMPAWAMELGEINIHNRLGETFSAKVPLTLNAGEAISNLYVEVAAPSDYRTLNVHRHPALNLIRTDIIRNRLTNWIEITSRSPINTPVFFLILKVQYGHATHFKKYSVFLDVSDGHHHKKRVTPPTTSTEDISADTSSSTYLSLDASLLTEDRLLEEIASKESTILEKPTTTFIPFDGWARTSNYGPIIQGDIIYTIADRLRIDKRYTIRQVMVALFEKNRSKFSEGNINLPIAGSYLDVPTAEEVERHSYEQALSMIRDHGQLWNKLIKQPRYAAVAEAQRSRYRNRDPESPSVR